MKMMGEDLGVIPPEVRSVMHQLNVPGVRIMRWERRYYYEGHPFILADDYDTISMTSLSTHDSESLAEWWEQFPHDAKLFAHTFNIPYHEKVSHHMRELILKLSHHTSSQYHVNPLQEYLDLEPKWSFENPAQERINIPGTISPFNWTFQVIPPIEEWTQDTHFAEKVKHLLP